MARVGGLFVKMPPVCLQSKIMKRIIFQAGKGMSGFFLGMIMATLVIAGVLFFLNTNKTTFKQHETAQRPAPQPEIMRPEGSGQPAPPPVAVRPEDTTEGTSPKDEAQAPKAAETADKKEADSATAPGDDKKAEDKPADKPKTTAKQPKPTPEQILESGSLEKAEQAAKDKADKAEAARRAQAAKDKAAKEKNAAAGKDKAAKTDTAAKDGKDKATGTKARVQAGSFKDNAAADAHRAKLAMLGVTTHVVKSTGANGQTVYRVQTGSMSRQQAEQTARRLKQNQIDSLVRSAP